MTEGYFDMLSPGGGSVRRDPHRPSVTRLSYSICRRQGRLSTDNPQDNLLIKNINKGYLTLVELQKSR
jgi:hypothetical protein